MATPSSCKRFELKIYVASSWRNAKQPDVVNELRQAGHNVYDFRNPAPGLHGFAWSSIDSKWKDWSPQEFTRALRHPAAVGGFYRDMQALKDARAVVLVMPCGRSAHLEFGWAVGRGKIGIILLSDGEPELMYKMADHLCSTVDEVCEVLKGYPFQ